MERSRDRLLYVSPVVPAVTGNGLAMRAGTVLQALATRYRVSLLVVPLYAGPESGVPVAIARHCRQVIVVPRGRLGSPPPPPPPVAGSWLGRTWRRGGGLAAEADTARPIFGDEPFDVVHLFRLATLPFARPWLDAAGGAVRRHLDLDEVESVSRRRLAALYRRNGRDERAAVEDAAARRNEETETDVMQTFDRLYVCSAVDRTRLAGRGPAEVRVLPNALPVPASLPPRRAGDPFTFLFVGTLGYYPNEDAVVWFCREVLPLIRRAATGEVRVTIVGGGAAPAVKGLEQAPAVRVVGYVPRLGPWYAEAGAVVVPVRAGGGTLIKLLEAFAYRRPVVATTIGCDGIEARNGEHLLVGDTALEFAGQCLRLIDDDRLARRLTTRAYDLFSRAYSTSALARIVGAWP